MGLREGLGSAEPLVLPLVCEAGGRGFGAGPSLGREPWAVASETLCSALTAPLSCRACDRQHAAAPVLGHGQGPPQLTARRPGHVASSPLLCAFPCTTDCAGETGVPHVGVLTQKGGHTALSVCTAFRAAFWCWPGARRGRQRPASSSAEERVATPCPCRLDFCAAALRAGRLERGGC